MITIKEIKEVFEQLSTEDIKHPALKRVAERIKSEPIISHIYSRMHHRHSRSNNKEKEK